MKTGENRKSRRVPYRIAIQYKDLKRPDIRLVYLPVRNLSSGGFCFQSGEFIPLAERLMLEILIPSATRPIKAVSKVEWIRKDPLTDLYEGGSRFLEMSKEDRKSLVSFCG